MITAFFENNPNLTTVKLLPWSHLSSLFKQDFGCLALDILIQFLVDDEWEKRDIVALYEFQECK